MKMLSAHRTATIKAMKEESGHLEAQTDGRRFSVYAKRPRPVSVPETLAERSTLPLSDRSTGITPKDPRSDGVAPCLYLASE
jgi:hypothetical protein